MEGVVAGQLGQGQVERTGDEPGLELLLADDDAGVRSLVRALARDRLEALSVLEAADGAEAVELALERRPQIALLDVAMPRLGGIETALTLRELQPQMRIALQTDEPLVYRGYARTYRLPLFDKLELHGAIGWVELQARAWAGKRLRRSALSRKLSLECTACGYGVARSTPPERCPMCHRQAAWLYTPWRLWSHEREVTY